MRGQKQEKTILSQICQLFINKMEVCYREIRALHNLLIEVRCTRMIISHKVKKACPELVILRSNNKI